MEDELNLKLFHRDKRKGLILTDIGHEILILARQMEKTENRMYQAAFRSNNFIGGKVRIASMPILTSVILSEVFYRFHKLYPYVSIELIEGSSMDIRKAIEEHQVDLGIFSAPFDTLDYQLLFTDRMIGSEYRTRTFHFLSGRTRNCNGTSQSKKCKNITKLYCLTGGIGHSSRRKRKWHRYHLRVYSKQYPK